MRLPTDIYVFDKQNLFDIAVKEFGDIDAVFSIINKNDVDFDKKLEAGEILDISGIDIIRNDISNYFKTNNIIPATGLTEEEYYKIYEDMTIPELTFKIKRYQALGVPRNQPDSLFAKWQATDKRFLAFNPEIWLFTEKRRTRKFPGNETLVTKSFGHVPHENGIKYPNSAFYAGKATNYFSVNYKTEFDIKRESGDYIELPINVIDYFKKGTNTSNYAPIDINEDLTGLNITIASGKPSRSLVMKFAIVIDNPDKLSRYPKLFGAMSAPVTLTAVKIGSDYKFIYKLIDK